MYDQKALTKALLSLMVPGSSEEDWTYSGPFGHWNIVQSLGQMEEGLISAEAAAEDIIEALKNQS